MKEMLQMEISLFIEKNYGKKDGYPAKNTLICVFLHNN